MINTALVADFEYYGVRYSFMILFVNLKLKHNNSLILLSVRDLYKVFDTLFFYYQKPRINKVNLMHLQVVSFSIIAGAIYDKLLAFNFILHCLGPPS